MEKLFDKLNNITRIIINSSVFDDNCIQVDQLSNVIQRLVRMRLTTVKYKDHRICIQDSVSTAFLLVNTTDISKEMYHIIVISDRLIHNTEIESFKIELTDTSHYF